MKNQKQNDFEDRVMEKFNDLAKETSEKIRNNHGGVWMIFDAYKFRITIKEAIREAQIPEERISQLRQWINEKPKDRLVTNEDIKMWLYGKENYEKVSI